MHSHLASKKHVKDNYLIDYSCAKFTTQHSKVFEGEKIEPKLKVVAKEIEITPKTNLSLILNEAKLLQKLSHPNIIKMYDYCFDNNTFSMYLELCKFTLRSYEGQQLSKRTILSYAKQIADGMDYLHSMGVLHLDLKPENILVSYDYTVKIIDFGESLENKNTKLGREIKATLSYCPSYIFNISSENEVVEFDEKFDVWSFGTIIYELYFKKCLLNGDNKVALKNAMKRFEENQNDIINSEKIRDKEILDLLRLTLKVNKNQRATFKEIKQYLSFTEKVEEKLENPHKKIQIQPTFYIPDCKAQNGKKSTVEISKKHITYIDKYKNYMLTKINEVSNLFYLINSKNRSENCLPYLIEKSELTVIKISLLTILNELYHTLTTTLQSQELILNIPEEITIKVANISGLYKTQHLNKFIKETTEKYEHWKKEFKEHLEHFKNIVLGKESFRVYQSLVKNFKNFKGDIFSAFLWSNPQRYIAMVLKRYVVDIEKVSVSGGAEDEERREVESQVARDNLYYCSMVCAMERLLPENQFMNNEIYHCFNDLKNAEKSARNHEAMRNILASLDMQL